MPCSELNVKYWCHLHGVLWDFFKDFLVLILAFVREMVAVINEKSKIMIHAFANGQ